MKVFLVLMATIFVLNAGTLRVRVDESTLVYSNVRERVQIGTTTRTERVRVQCQNTQNTDRNTIGLDTLIGIGAGVALGNQIGHGNGRAAAKVAGGVIGGYTANHLRNSGNSGSCYEDRQYNEPTYRYEYKKYPTGYRNCGYIQDQRVCKVSKHKLHYLTLDFYVR